MTEEHTSEPDNLLELTRAYIEKWQSLGLMPELAPGEVLVWKYVSDSRHLATQEDGSFKWEPHYAARWHDETEYYVGVPYDFDRCLVAANPRGVFWPYHRERGFQGVLLAVRAKTNDLRLCLTTHSRRGTLFHAPRGVPVAAYNAFWRCHEHYRFFLVQGEEVLDLLPDPLVCIEHELVDEKDGQLPPPPDELDAAEAAKNESPWAHTAETKEEAIQFWQNEGWMPEVRPGQVLVWKQVVRLGPFRGRPSEYRCDRYFGRPPRVWLDRPFEFESCEVSPNWDEAVWYSGEDFEHDHEHREGDENQPTFTCVAILAERDSLLFSGYVVEDECSSDFHALRGIPVACFEMVPDDDGEWALRLIEGEDAREWLP